LKNERNAVIVIPRGEGITLWGLDRDLTTLRLGRIKAKFVLWPDENDTGSHSLAKHKFTVSFEVAPSELMVAVWGAKSEADRARLREDMRDLLRRRADRHKWRERRHVEGSLRYMAGYALAFLDDALEDPDPVVRSQAIEAYDYSAWAVRNMNAHLHRFDKDKKRPKWAEGLEKGDAEAAKEARIRAATAGLGDADARVRLSAVRVLTWREAKSALDEVKKLTSDPDASVRSAVQAYLSKFGGEADVAERILASLSDRDAKVRDEALRALERSPEPPPLASLKGAFQTTKGDAGLRLLALLFEREDADLPSALVSGFRDRTAQERLAILTAIAGHTSDAALQLVRLGLEDRALDVQRAALMRLLGFPRNTALALLQGYARKESSPLRGIADAVRKEIVARRIFPFLSSLTGRPACASETVFRSQNGTVPMVSPDGKWLAYVETGWGRWGGSGGFGRSNLVSLVHAVKTDGTDDRLISDMFLVSWLADSRHIASARDGHAAVCNLEGEIVAEFGQALDAEWQKYADQRAKEWRKYAGRSVERIKGVPRFQGGPRMPHRKRLTRPWNMSESGTFSPDGKWIGPVSSDSGAAFINAEGERIQVRVPAGAQFRHRQATWSPAGRYVVLTGLYWNRILVMDTQARDSNLIDNVDPVQGFGSWDYRKCRWNPWSRDGSRIAFLRGSQVWIAAPDGRRTRQLTFDTARKAFPTFSPDGKRVAYVTWQSDRRRHYHRLGPTDLWVVEIETTLAVRSTASAAGRIHCLDWLDNDTLVFDRVGDASLGYGSSLRRLSLKP